MESEWLGLGETFKGHLVLPPSHEQGLLQLQQVAQSLVQPDLDASRDGASTTSLTIVV